MSKKELLGVEDFLNIASQRIFFRAHLSRPNSGVFILYTYEAGERLLGRVKVSDFGLESNLIPKVEVWREEEAHSMIQWVCDWQIKEHPDWNLKKPMVVTCVWSYPNGRGSTSCEKKRVSPLCTRVLVALARLSALMDCRRPKGKNEISVWATIGVRLPGLIGELVGEQEGAFERMIPW